MRWKVKEDLMVDVSRQALETVGMGAGLFRIV
jgi:hypothetical protein